MQNAFEKIGIRFGIAFIKKSWLWHVQRCDDKAERPTYNTRH
jgi:hypothetical protein